MSATEQDVHEALKALVGAEQALKAAEDDERIASRNHIQAQNKVNEAQRALAQIRKDLPHAVRERLSRLLGVKIP